MIAEGGGGEPSAPAHQQDAQINKPKMTKVVLKGEVAKCSRTTKSGKRCLPDIGQLPDRNVEASGGLGRKSLIFSRDASLYLMPESHCHSTFVILPGVTSASNGPKNPTLWSLFRTTL